MDTLEVLCYQTRAYMARLLRGGLEQLLLRAAGAEVSYERLHRHACLSLSSRGLGTSPFRLLMSVRNVYFQ
jgi:hypothetical protein